MSKQTETIGDGTPDPWAPVPTAWAVGAEPAKATFKRNVDGKFDVFHKTGDCALWDGEFKTFKAAHAAAVRAAKAAGRKAAGK